MNPPPLTVTVTINVDTADLEAVLARLAATLRGAAVVDAGPVPSLDNRPPHGPTPCDVPGCTFVARTPGGLGPHRKARHPERLGLKPGGAWEETPAPITDAPEELAPSVDRLDGLTIDIGPVTIGEPEPVEAPAGPTPRPVAVYNPDEYRCGCGAAFAFRSDLARHRLAEDHHESDEVDA
jgi:hypothetical protein